MNRKYLLWIISVITVVTILLTCNLIQHNDQNKSPKGLLPASEMVSDRLEGYHIEWYNNISSIMIDDRQILQEEVVQEYIIANSISFQGVEHIDIMFFADGTGKLTQKFYNSEFESKGKMIIHESISLTKYQLSQITSVFEENHFWEIPSKHPEEELGLDGNTIFIEGIHGNKYNIISMWNPNDKYEIKKIYHEITHLAELWGLSMNP